MRVPTPLPLLLLLPLLLHDAPARAEDEVLRDEWSATFDGGRKVAWEHERVVRHATGYRRETHGWLPHGDRVLESVAWIEIDAHGRILALERRSEGPHGKRAVSARTEGGKLRWTARIRELPEQSGELPAGKAWSPTVIQLKTLRGELPPGARDLDVLDIPGKGIETKQHSYTRDGETWISKGPNWKTHRGPQGQLIRGEFDHCPVLVTLPATAKDASDCAVTAPLPKAPVIVDKDTFQAFGLRVRRPDPTWTLCYERLPEGAELLGLESRCSVELAAVTLPMRLPPPGPERLAMARVLRKSLNARDKDCQLAEPEATEWRGRAVVRLALSGRGGGAPSTGLCYLVERMEGSLLVFLAWPQDLSEVLRDERARIEQALELDAPGPTSTAPAPARWQRVEVAGANISMEVPAGWKPKTALTPTEWASPSGASRVTVNQGPLPPNLTIPECQEAWVESMKKNPKLKVEVEKADDPALDGRRCSRMVLKGRVDNEGVSSHFRVASYAFARADGSYVEVIVALFDFDVDPAQLEEFAKRLRWAEEH
ncbi:MAG: hypothetical protein AB7N76_37165 [Planctomycetota bacterium]